jgi:hypothetical protein
VQDRNDARPRIATSGRDAAERSGHAFQNTDGRGKNVRLAALALELRPEVAIRLHPPSFALSRRAPLVTHQN